MSTPYYNFQVLKTFGRNNNYWRCLQNHSLILSNYFKWFHLHSNRFLWTSKKNSPWSSTGLLQCCRSRSGIRDPVPFWPLDLDPGSRIPNPYFWEVSGKFVGKKFYNSLKTGLNFFLLVKLVAIKKIWQKNFFHPSLLLLFLNPGSEIQNKHPGSATLVF